MSAGSGASNLGYGEITPLSNVNGNYVNVHNTNNPISFGSNEIPGLPGLAGSKSNIDAAAGNVPGICLFKGGAKKLKKKIKNITKKYKMKSSRRKMMKLRSIKNKVKSRYMSVGLARTKSKTGGKRRKNSKRTMRRRRQMGGYSQYQNNLPMTPSYSVGGVLSASELGLANPPPYKVLSNCTNCVDNYNHYTNQGFPSKGH